MPKPEGRLGREGPCPDMFPNGQQRGLCPDEAKRAEAVGSTVAAVAAVAALLWLRVRECAVLQLRLKKLLEAVTVSYLAVGIAMSERTSAITGWLEDDGGGSTSSRCLSLLPR